MARRMTTDRAQISRRGALGLLGASAAAIPLAACGGGGSGSGSGATGALAMLDYDTPQQAVLTKKVLSAFQAQTKISTSLSTEPGSGASIYPGQLRTQILGDKAPDVFRRRGGTIVQPFIDSHQVISLDSTYAKYGWDAILSAPNVKDFTFNGVPALHHPGPVPAHQPGQRLLQHPEQRRAGLADAGRRREGHAAGS